ncbi:MAG: hypothetical protein JOZ07_16580 [Solirubrobacterales bacterium]|nr:hypothetical protein [Solirubrobacterales bacterium]
MARDPQGKFLGLPYNLTPLKREHIGKGVWDPDDSRIFTPKNFGWGYGLNFAALLGRTRRRSG